MEILAYIGSHWVEWLVGICIAGLGLVARKTMAIAGGVQSLLRESIVANYNSYTDKGYCPIYAKESLKNVYSAYHNLGGNDVATQLYNKLLELPTEPREEENNG